MTSRLDRRRLALTRAGLGCAIALLPVLCCCRASDAQETVAGPRMGTNLNGPADWNTEVPFVDVFRLSRAWISQRRGEGWGKGPALALDAKGWVTRLEPGCFAETPLCTITGGHYPAGQYTVLYEGTGKLEFGGSATIASEGDHRLVLNVEPAKGPIWLRVIETDPADYLKHIRVLLPGHEATYQTEPFRPGFLDMWRGMACLRFMDWQHTNGSKQQNWDERPTLDDATWTRAGVPVEVMVDLCNRLEADPWFCMPHLADDDYVRRFAQMVKDRLAPERQVWVEYSNEVWNGQFEQSRWAGQQGIAKGFHEKPWEAGWKFCAWRSTQVFAIWADIFGGADRLRRVLPTQAANPYVTERIVEFEDAYKHADAVAIAPYISFNIPARGDGLTADTVAGWTVEQVLDEVEQQRLPQALDWIARQKQVADKYGLGLVAYEGGQHLVGVAGGENNDALTKLLQAANRHPRMEGIYQRYFDGWRAAGGGLFCYFSSVGSWSKWGSWGLLEYLDEDPAESPKYRAVRAAASAWGQRVGGD